MAQHAFLSASSSHRWIPCPPSVKLEESFENKSSVFAEEGTAAHALSEYKLKKYLGEKVKKPKSEFDEKELEYYTGIYFDYACELILEVKARIKDPIILVEQRLDFSNYVPEGFGTGDLVIVADGILDIMDLKYGKGVEVSAVNNPQMMLYAIGALNLFDSLYDIEKVRMTICQPRIDNISTFEITVEELIKWAEDVVTPKAELAIKGEGDFCAGEHCRFCRARFNCRARAEENMKMAQYDFRKGPLLTEDEITEILSNIGEFQKWAKDIETYAFDKAINENKKWTGFKLVEGRSIRKYSDEEAVSKALIEAGFAEDVIYSKSLLGITAMEKAIGKKKFKELLKDLVYKPQGKLTLVVESDKRPEIKNTAEADFRN
ncbi:DUF2800 domain-containing protein [Clostridium sporogenes]|uniref:DUF2800 domain-containing protein n=1 Tax=Clostridium sporogenes TaxID=1509 RepID=UPI00024BA02A|nr:DUF2800 domain-containing protein [Clostridium sporogenes]EHN13414.1 hypothetical protein IYC_17965 [Clostridium sporogenes PA 3679]MDU4598317.1 DUF2800 domain-containing protein [Clostridium sporogenes]NFQ33537.1 DUF2800 domain-containing protein [Clostridium sporogenes]NFQ61181.1 DUF2800 domain-containing protein [Clostridium sporogenes]NFU09096.1 DUF2800 domain-containing protein [Clostridium sporogenes]